jgi:hypothetical protein
MTRSELIEALNQRFPSLTQAEATATVTAILAALEGTLAAGGRVEVRGFGTPGQESLLPSRLRKGFISSQAWRCESALTRRSSPSLHADGDAVPVCRVFCSKVVLEAIVVVIFEISPPFCRVFLNKRVDSRPST